MHDDDIERVLKSAGAREKPPVEVERAVREGLRTEWRAMLDTRRVRQRRFTALALAAGVAAAVIGVSVSTVTRDWRFARAWLAERLGEQAP